jgi:hypothetical protein
MSNDAKLGLVLGVAIVVVIGLVFFRTDPPLAVQAASDTGVMTTALPFERAWSKLAQAK